MLRRRTPQPLTTRNVGLSDEESRELLPELGLQARVRGLQVRFRRPPDSIVIWDDIAVQH
ncbi:hypothetical protein AB9Q10_45655 [Streptomyces krungchingensis]|uniref:hypothetical protein n=1 Tax=Streptomyces krungchingensis TaxID=1565034 RepID=UPI003CF618D4